MPRYNQIKNSLLGGEITPKAYGRTDLQIYNHACAKLENFIPKVQGGADKRPGTVYVREPGQTATRTIPFVYSTAESYVVELNGAIGSGNIRIVNCADNTVITPGTSAATIAYYDVTQVDDVQFVQSADVLYLVHPSVGPQHLVRTALNTFELRRFTYAEDSASKTVRWVKMWPFRTRNTTATAVYPGATTGSGVAFTADAALFNSSMVGSVWKVTQAGVTGAIFITGYTSTTVMTGTVINTFGASGVGNKSSAWEESAWSTYRGWPRTVGFYEGRIVYGGNTYQPDTLWFSDSASFLYLMARHFDQDTVADTSTINYIGTYNDSDPFDRTLSSNQVNQIQWLASRDVLVAGTAGAEWIIDSADRTAGFSSANITGREQTSHGSKYTRPAVVGNSVLFADRTGQSIRDFSFSFDDDSYVADDIMVLANHMPGSHTNDSSLQVLSNVKQMAWSESDKTLWWIDEVGGLFSITRDKKTGIVASARHVIGGTYPNGTYTTFAKVTSICVVPATDSAYTYDQLWLVVERRINSSTKKYLEKMHQPYGFESLQYYTAASIACTYMDSAKFQDLGSVGTAVSNLSHLEGQVVQVIGDGLDMGTYTVSAGAITLTSARRYVIAGLPYSSKIITLTPDMGAAIGSAHGSIQKIDRVVVRFYRSIECSVGSSFDVGNMEDLVFRSPTLALDTITPVFTGLKDMMFQHSPDREAQVYILHDWPFPCSVVSVMIRGTVSDA